MFLPAFCSFIRYPIQFTVGRQKNSQARFKPISKFNAIYFSYFECRMNLLIMGPCFASQGWTKDTLHNRISIISKQWILSLTSSIVTSQKGTFFRKNTFFQLVPVDFNNQTVCSDQNFTCSNLFDVVGTVNCKLKKYLLEYRR